MIWAPSSLKNINNDNGISCRGSLDDNGRSCRGSLESNVRSCRGSLNPLVFEHLHFRHQSSPNKAINVQKSSHEAHAEWKRTTLKRAIKKMTAVVTFAFRHRLSTSEVVRNDVINVCALLVATSVQNFPLGVFVNPLKMFQKHDELWDRHFLFLMSGPKVLASANAISRQTVRNRVIDDVDGVRCREELPKAHPVKLLVNRSSWWFYSRGRGGNEIVSQRKCDKAEKLLTKSEN